MFPWIIGGLLTVLGLYQVGKKTGGGPYGNAGAGSGSPLPAPVLPSGPPGLVFALPAVGQLYRPNVYTPETRARDFAGRHAIEQWAAHETTPADAPKERHDHIMACLDAGQLDAPEWNRITVRPAGLEGGSLEVEVAGDVVSYGGVRLCGPMRSHQAIADAWGGLIPTPKIVDAIWRFRTLSLAPQTIGWCSIPGKCVKVGDGGEWTNPGGAVRWLLYYADRVAEEIQSRAAEKILTNPAALLRPTLSTLGKDYVLAPELLTHPASCAIYGWTKADGTVFQSPESGASYKHFLDYYDYSHSLRIVRRLCWVDGIQADLAEVYRTRPDWLNHHPGQGPIPIRHPSIPPRAPAGTLI